MKIQTLRDLLSSFDGEQEVIVEFYVDDDLVQADIEVVMSEPRCEEDGEMPAVYIQLGSEEDAVYSITEEGERALAEYQKKNAVDVSAPTERPEMLACKE